MVNINGDVQWAVHTSSRDGFEDSTGYSAENGAVSNGEPFSTDDFVDVHCDDNFGKMCNSDDRAEFK